MKSKSSNSLSDVDKYKKNLEQLDYLRLEAKERYQSVQDMTVSANKTDDAIAAIKNIQKSINAIETQNAKLLKKNGDILIKATANRSYSSTTT